MGLNEYKKKRSFNKTPEPKGDKKGLNGALHFVIQKHAASRLHYDFRLEMQGVLKSWAVPKGPSLNPEDKRLAMMVEDHPYDYKDFEGIIPPGNYGAGTVIVWDEGTYEPYVPVEGDRKQQEKELLKELHRGDLKFVLHGKKVKGAYALVHIKGREENAWLLIKKKDKYAKDIDITKKDKSVQSGMKLEQVAKESTNEWQSNRKTKSSKSKSVKSVKSSKSVVSKSSKPPVKKKPAPVAGLPDKGRKAKIPSGIAPMLATLTDKPFDDDDWLFEIKWDGYRALSYIQKGKVELLSRKNLSFNAKFSPVAQALKELGAEAVLDGEIVSVNSEGKGDFQLLQQWQKTGKGQLLYYVFDILWLNGKSLVDLPLTERKEILKSILPENDIIRFSDHIVGKGKEFYEEASRQGLEGIMAKKADSTYSPDVRTRQWLKIKTHRRQEAVICGFTEPRRSRKYFGALVLGVYENGELKYAGHTGTGFTEKLQADVYKKLKPLIAKETPFDKKPKTNMPCTWVKPKLVCEIKFGEWTQENIMRIPVFLGLREDKNPKEVTREKPVPLTSTAAKKAAQKKKAATKKVISRKDAKAQSKTGALAPSREKLLDHSQTKQTLTIDGKELTFTNPQKIYWPKEKITKGEVIEYYHRIAPYILPYLKDRPQSLNRNPNGISKPGFYQKDVTGTAPDWAKTHPYTTESDNQKKQYLVCTDEASLLYMANLGCIEINPWLSTIHNPDNPDWCVIDLDPGKISFGKVIEAAQVVKQVLDDLDVESFCKTSGSTGLHIYIPLGAKYDYDQSRQLAELLVTQVHHEIPSFTSLERSPAKRKTKIYLDYLQNRTVQTIAAPYSLRPKPGATVSTPLHWEEVKKGLTIQDFNIKNIHDRLKEVGDIWKPVMGSGIDMEKVLNKLSKMMAED
jgi:bifunctional non-homologous end joining protein LigD